MINSNATKQELIRVVFTYSKWSSINSFQCLLEMNSWILIVICTPQAAAFEQSNCYNITGQEKLVLFMPASMRQWLKRAAKHASIENIAPYTTRLRCHLHHYYTLLNSAPNAQITSARLDVTSQESYPPQTTIELPSESGSSVSFALAQPINSEI